MFREHIGLGSGQITDLLLEIFDRVKYQDMDKDRAEALNYNKYLDDIDFYVDLNDTKYITYGLYAVEYSNKILYFHVDLSYFSYKGHRFKASKVVYNTNFYTIYTDREWDADTFDFVLDRYFRNSCHVTKIHYKIDSLELSKKDEDEVFCYYTSDKLTTQLLFTTPGFINFGKHYFCVPDLNKKTRGLAAKKGFCSFNVKYLSYFSGCEVFVSSIDIYAEDINLFLKSDVQLTVYCIYHLWFYKDSDIQEKKVKDFIKRKDLSVENVELCSICTMDITEKEVKEAREVELFQITFWREGNYGFNILSNYGCNILRNVWVSGAYKTYRPLQKSGNLYI